MKPGTVLTRPLIRPALTRQQMAALRRHLAALRRDFAAWHVWLSDDPAGRLYATCPGVPGTFDAETAREMRARLSAHAGAELAAAEKTLARWAA